MKHLIAIAAITSALSFSVSAQPAPKQNEPTRTSPIEQKLTIDAAKLQAQMNVLLDIRDNVNARITVLQKKLDESTSTSEKLRK
jgi:hypothetical protein